MAQNNAQTPRSAQLRATAARIGRDPELAAAVVGIASAERAIAVLEALAARLEADERSTSTRRPAEL